MSLPSSNSRFRFAALCALVFVPLTAAACGGKLAGEGLELDLDADLDASFDAASEVSVDAAPVDGTADSSIFLDAFEDGGIIPSDTAPLFDATPFDGITVIDVSVVDTFVPPPDTLLPPFDTFVPPPPDTDLPPPPDTFVLPDTFVPPPDTFVLPDTIVPPFDTSVTDTFVSDSTIIDGGGFDVTPPPDAPFPDIGFDIGSTDGGIRCGAATCDPGTQECCAAGGGGGGGGLSCVAKGKCGGTTLTCSNASHCAIPGQVCCLAGGGGAASATCSFLCVGIQLCATNAECRFGTTCRPLGGGYRFCN